jgi:hypothetical protein
VDKYHFRNRRIQVLLSQEEYEALRGICQALGVAARDILMLGVRRARAALAREQRKQRRLGAEGC